MPRYEDYAEYYDLDHGGDFDIAFYREYAEANGPRVLELACGTGRILVRLAERGIDIDGLDFSDNMLSVCRDKLSRMAPSRSPSLFCADMADFRLPCKEYGLIYIPVRSFMHLFTSLGTPGPFIVANIWRLPLPAVGSAPLGRDWMSDAERGECGPCP